MKEKLGGGWGELKSLAERSGAPEAKKLADDTTQQIVAIFKDGKLVRDNDFVFSADWIGH